MKRYQYVVAITCLLVSAIGFVGLYATSQSEDKNDVAKNEQIVEESEEIILGSNLSNTEKEDNSEVEKENQIAGIDGSANIEDALSDAKDLEDDNQKNIENDAPVGTITQEVLHFKPENGVVWPVEGTVLLDYSVDSTIFFPTLQQYQYNPAMVISGKVNDKVYFVAKGKITNIETNEETGCTVTQDLGDGYTVVYGQLKELNFDVGDIVESGQVVGYISEPTKYYSVEGSNVYFQVLKDNKPIDPEEILP